MQSNLHDVKERSTPLYSTGLDDFICPVNDYYVNVSYCESFCFGVGCRDLNVCKAYGVGKNDKK